MNCMGLHVRSYSLADFLLSISHAIVLLVGIVCARDRACVIVVSSRTSLRLNEARWPSMWPLRAPGFGVFLRLVLTDYVYVHTRRWILLLTEVMDHQTNRVCTLKILMCLSTLAGKCGSYLLRNQHSGDWNWRIHTAYKTRHCSLILSAI
jgi:hypothetical protein